MTDTTAQVYQVLIRATAERIWDALVRPEFTRRYFYGVDVDTTAEPGTPFVHRLHGQVAVDGEVLEADRPHRLVVSWRPMYDPVAAGEPATRVTWRIEPQRDGVCLLTTTHDRLENSPTTADNVRDLGWTTVLSGLKTLLETGEPLFPPRTGARTPASRSTLLES